MTHTHTCARKLSAHTGQHTHMHAIEHTCRSAHAHPRSSVRLTDQLPHTALHPLLRAANWTHVNARVSSKSCRSHCMQADSTASTASGLHLLIARAHRAHMHLSLPRICLTPCPRLSVCPPPICALASSASGWPESHIPCTSDGTHRSCRIQTQHIHVWLCKLGHVCAVTGERE